MDNVKYSIEYEEGRIVETLRIDDYKASKIWEYDDDDEEYVTGDEDFSVQFDAFFDEEICENIANSYDDTCYVDDIDDFVNLCEIDEDDDEY